MEKQNGTRYPLINEWKGDAMRKFVTSVFVLVLMLGGVSEAAYPKNCFQEKESVIDKTGDWFATLGKQGLDKQSILLQRKRDRFTTCIQKN
jgi:hypothetical protein